MNKNFVHQVGDQPRLYYDARSTNHQDLPYLYGRYVVSSPVSVLLWTVFPEYENWQPSDHIMTRKSLNYCDIEAETVTTVRISIVIPEAGEELIAETPSAVCFSAESIMRYDNIASAFHFTKCLIVDLLVNSWDGKFGMLLTSGLRLLKGRQLAL
jgi:hypothetical protein